MDCRPTSSWEADMKPTKPVRPKKSRALAKLLASVRPPKSRQEMLAALHKLPPAAVIPEAYAAADIHTTTSVMRSWRDQKRGPRFFGSNEFVRYRPCDLDAWMLTRAGEIDEGRERDDAREKELANVISLRAARDF